MKNVYKSQENKNGEIIELVQSPFDSNNFAILNRTKNEYTCWSDIADRGDADRKFDYLVNKNMGDVWNG